MGIVVDSVSDVTLLRSDQIKPPPRLGAQINIEYLIGVGAIEERMLLLIDISQLMSADDFWMIKKIAA